MYKSNADLKKRGKKVVGNNARQSDLTRNVGFWAEFKNAGGAKCDTFWVLDFDRQDLGESGGIREAKSYEICYRQLRN